MHTKHHPDFRSATDGPFVFLGCEFSTVQTLIDVVDVEPTSLRLVKKREQEHIKEIEPEIRGADISSAVTRVRQDEIIPSQGFH